jgi:cyclohexanone monooxygenase
VVFQRTPSFSVPARNAPLDPEFIQYFRTNHDDFVQGLRGGTIFGSGDLSQTPAERQPVAASAMDVTEQERERVFSKRWELGGSCYMACFPDQMINARSNDEASNFIRRKIKEIVHDPRTAEALIPYGYPLGSKRICLDTNYYATFNRSNVRLVDTRNNPIVEITESGIRTQNDSYMIDSIVFATGFDAMTGALNRIDIQGRDGVKLSKEWAAGPVTYLGLMVSGFPNLFLVTGPGSPSVISNVVTSIEQHVEWIGACLKFMQLNRKGFVEATAEAQTSWVNHVNDVANSTLFPVANSWYVGANIPGKARVFMPYVAGVAAYRKVCDAIAAEGYRGFHFGDIESSALDASLSVGQHAPYLRHLSDIKNS